MTDTYWAVAVAGLTFCLVMSLAFNIHQRGMYNHACDEARRLVDKIIAIRAELSQAQRNDHRDPETGRFVKA